MVSDTGFSTRESHIQSAVKIELYKLKSELY